MRGLKSYPLALLAVLFLAFAACYDDDDGYGPTEPLPPRNIEGLWSGVFSTDEGEAEVFFDLTQRGRRVSGLLSVGALVWSLDGEVDSAGRFTWETFGSTCGSFDGRLTLFASTHMEGTANLDRFFCPEGERLRGDLFLDRQPRR